MKCKFSICQIIKDKESPFVWFLGDLEAYYLGQHDACYIVRNKIRDDEKLGKGEEVQDGKVVRVDLESRFLVKQSGRYALIGIMPAEEVSPGEIPERLILNPFLPVDSPEKIETTKTAFLGDARLRMQYDEAEFGKHHRAYYQSSNPEGGYLDVRGRIENLSEGKYLSLLRKAGVWAKFIFEKCNKLDLEITYIEPESQELQTTEIRGQKPIAIYHALFASENRTAGTTEIKKRIHYFGDKSIKSFFEKPPKNKAFFDNFIHHEKGTQHYALKFL